jgi:hypothetical protein
MDDRPHGNCYWDEPGRLLAGEYPGAQAVEETRRKVGRFLDCGVDYFIDLTEVGELAPYHAILREVAGERGIPVGYERMPIPDVDVPRSRSDMVAILDAIDGAVAARRTVYVHCWGGVGRTGTVVGCHFGRRGAEGETALERLAALWLQMAKSRRRPRTPETAEQTEYVQHWREDVRGPGGQTRIALRREIPASRRDQEHVVGCLLGGAVGDALGAPVEFWSLQQIREHYEAAGIADLAPAYGRAGAITDDTQMTLFTAEGLL